MKFVEEPCVAIIRKRVVEEDVVPICLFPTTQDASKVRRDS